MKGLRIRNPHLCVVILGWGVMLLAGCVTPAEVKKTEPSFCEVHQVAMTIQSVEVVPGTSVYLPEFRAAMREGFPHHGRVYHAEDHLYLSARPIRVYVCPACTAAYDTWQKAHGSSR